MLLKDFYTVKTETINGNQASFRVSLNPAARIYEGHFPGNPVTPGVCIIQMIVECASRLVGEDAAIRSINRCRFLKPVIPGDCEYYDVEIKVEKKDIPFVLEASLTDGISAYVDFKGEIISHGQA